MHDDPLVRRVWRSSALVCLAAAAAAWLWFGVAAAAAVVGGGVLIGVSFYTLGSGVAALVAAAAGQAPRRVTMGRNLVKVVFRYALLGFLAYVMIARLRLHPIGLIVGASSIFAAVCIEAARSLAKKSS
ncbi:MAG TPA: ATP synthase subunit I [Vicinamibacterales bacterium]|nr:ATP synthase subunit I [Vicinamibacterales bacterium]